MGKNSIRLVFSIFAAVAVHMSTTPADAAVYRFGLADPGQSTISTTPGSAVDAQIFLYEDLGDGETTRLGDDTVIGPVGVSLVEFTLTRQSVFPPPPPPPAPPPEPFDKAYFHSAVVNPEFYVPSSIDGPYAGPVVASLAGLDLLDPLAPVVRGDFYSTNVRRLYLGTLTFDLSSANPDDFNVVYAIEGGVTLFPDLEATTCEESFFSIYINDVQPVPEPAGLVLWSSLGCCGLVAGRIRRKKAA